MSTDTPLVVASTRSRVFKPSIAQSVGDNALEGIVGSPAAIWAFDMVAALSDSVVRYAPTSTMMISPIGIGDDNEALRAAMVWAYVNHSTTLQGVALDLQEDVVPIAPMAATAHRYSQLAAAVIATSQDLILGLQPEGLPTAPATTLLSKHDTATSRDMVAVLKAKGMPIAALAEVLDVERKTVYSWLDFGIEPNPTNHNRLGVVYDLLSSEADGSLRFFHRFWERKISAGCSLKEALMATDIDAPSVIFALDALRPTVERSTRANAERKLSSAEKSSSSTLTIDLIAGRWS